jgi:hypothetical protein
MGTSSKNEMIERIKQERLAWDDLLASVGEENMSQPGVTGAWTLKDVITHIMAWREREMAYLEAAQQGLEPAQPEWWHDLGDHADTDRINQWIYEQNFNRSLDEVLSASRKQFIRLEALVDSLSEKELTDPRRFAWMKGKPLGPTVLDDCFDHFHAEHESTVHAWLAKLDK